MIQSGTTVVKHCTVVLEYLKPNFITDATAQAGLAPPKRLHKKFQHKLLNMLWMFS